MPKEPFSQWLLTEMSNELASKTWKLQQLQHEALKVFPNEPSLTFLGSDINEKVALLKDVGSLNLQAIAKEIGAVDEITADLRRRIMDLLEAHVRPSTPIIMEPASPHIDPAEATTNQV